MRDFDLKKVERTRKIQTKFWTTPQEKAQILENMNRAGYRTLGSNLLKVGLDGYVANIDFSDIKSTLGELGSVRSELNKIGNNINQVTKHMNHSHEIDVMDFYILEEEMKSMRKQMEKFKKQVVQTFNNKINQLEGN